MSTGCAEVVQATPMNFSIASITLNVSGVEGTHLAVFDSDMPCAPVTPSIVFEKSWVSFCCYVCPYATPILVRPSH